MKTISSTNNVFNLNRDFWSYNKDFCKQNILLNWKIGLFALIVSMGGVTYFAMKLCPYSALIKLVSRSKNVYHLKD